MDFLQENVRHSTSIWIAIHGSKSEFIQEVTGTSKDNVVADHTSVVVAITDELAIFHMVQPKSSCTVDEYRKIYMKYIKLIGITDIVYDVYLHEA